MRGRMIVVSVLLLLFPSTIFALDSGKWYVGVGGDYVYNMMVTNTGYRENTYYDNDHGFAVSVPVVYQFNDWLGVESGLRYTQKNYGWRHKRYLQESYAYTDWENVKNHFLEIPIAVNFSFGNDTIQSVASVGAYMGFWVASQRYGTLKSSANTYAADNMLVDFNEMMEFDEVRDNRFEAGLLASTGFTINIDPVAFYLRGSFYLGLTDLSKRYQKDLVSRYNNSVTVEAGILVGFGGAK